MAATEETLAGDQVLCYLGLLDVIRRAPGAKILGKVTNLINHIFSEAITTGYV